MIDRTELRKLVEAMTPGEWSVIESRDVFPAIISPGLATIGNDFESDSDARGIVALRNNAVALLDALDAAEQELAAANRELERWRHGQPVEGDYVCPHQLEADELREQLDAAIKKIDELEVTLDDEEAAHTGTLRMLEIARADQLRWEWLAPYLFIDCNGRLNLRDNSKHVEGPTGASKRGSAMEAAIDAAIAEKGKETT